MFTLEIKSASGYALTQAETACGLNDLDAARAALGAHVTEVYRRNADSDPAVPVPESLARKYAAAFAETGRRKIIVPTGFLNAEGRSADEWENLGNGVASVRPKPCAKTILKQWAAAGYPERWGFPPAPETAE